MLPELDVVMQIWTACRREGNSLPPELVLRAARMRGTEFLDLFAALDAKAAQLQAERRKAEEAQRRV